MTAPGSRSKTVHFACAFAALLSGACNDPLKSASLIQETRVLGARVEVSGDAERASPAPGEAARLRLFVAAPDGAPNVAFAFSLCGVTPTNSGFPSCKTPPFASGFQPEPSGAEPAVDFTLPADFDVSATPHGLASGVICPASSAELSADGARCSAGPSDAFAFEFDLAGPGQDNGNPTFTADSLTLDDGPWSASAPGASCDTTQPVPAGSQHQLGLRLQDSDFDALIPVTSEDPTRETLLVSQFTTEGTLAHTFMSLTANAPQGTVSWSAPAHADPGGNLVFFYFVARDARGGEDLAVRTLCVLP